MAVIALPAVFFGFMLGAPMGYLLLRSFWEREYRDYHLRLSVTEAALEPPSPLASAVEEPQTKYTISSLLLPPPSAMLRLRARCKFGSRGVGSRRFTVLCQGVG